MKYYITTSSLNIDNILQSESILPISHYDQRVTGFNSFEQLEELRQQTCIVLFKFPVEFIINDTGRYNFPILIELEDDNQTKDVEERNNVCSCNHPLYLTPTNCRIFFFSKQAYDLTIINTKSNKAIKYYTDYQIYPTASVLQLVKMPVINNEDVAKCITKYEETHLDKQKGTLYAFLLGQKRSLNKELAKQLRLTQDLYDILTSLINTPSSISMFSNKLKDLLCEYRKVDTIEKSYWASFQNKLDDSLGKRFKFLRKCFIDFLKKLDCWNIVFDALANKWGYSFLPDVSDLKSPNDFVRLRSDIENRTERAISSYQKHHTTSLDGISLKGNSVELPNVPLINMAINYIITNSLTPDDLRANRSIFYMKIMKESGILNYLKGIVGEMNWDNSLEKRYVNELYAFIENPIKPFCLNNIDNLELKAFAAFLIKGHSLNDCLLYLKMNEIDDYRYVLALWGSLCGYMEMNKEYVSDVLSMEYYKQIYKKIFGYDMFIASLEKNLLQESNEDSDITELFSILQICKHSKYTELIDEIKKENGLFKTSFFESFENVLNKHKRETKQCKIARLAMTILQNKDNKENLRAVLEQSVYEKLITKTILNELLKHFGFAIPIKKTKNKTKSQSSKIKKEGESNINNIFGETSYMSDPIKVKSSLNTNRITKYFYNDDEVWEVIDSIVPIVSKTGIKRDLNWFQEQIRKPRQERLNYYQSIDETNNSLVIDKFCHLKERPKNGKEQAPYFTKELRERIRERLISYYARQDNDNNR